MYCGNDVGIRSAELGDDAGGGDAGDAAGVGLDEVEVAVGAGGDARTAPLSAVGIGNSTTSPLVVMRPILLTPRR